MKRKLWQKLSAVILVAVMLMICAVCGSTVVNAAGSNFTNATKINVNQTYTEKIATSSEKDYFKFTLGNDSKVSIDFSHEYIDSSSAYWRLYLYNSDDTEIYNYFRIPGNKRKISTCNMGLPKGDYYVKIVCGDLYTSTDYSLRINVTATDNWEKEFNNGYGNGTKIAVNKDYYGSLMSSSDKDFYKFTLQNNSKISINFSHEYIDSSSAYWRLYLYNSDDTEIYNYFRIPGNKMNLTTCNIGLSSGEYYMKIVCGDSYTGMDYSIKINYTSTNDWEKEFNDGYGTGTKITANKNYYGALMSSSDKDFYKFTLQNDSKININFSHDSIDTETACWRLYLYDMSNTEIYNYFRIPGSKFAITTDSINLKKGDYYIKIVCGDAYTGIDYSLKVVVPNSIINPTSVSLDKTSLSLSKGGTYTLKATVAPSNATNKTVTWTTSDSNVATVSGGKITAKGVGTATITAKTSNSKTAICKVTVVNPLTNNSTLSATSITLGQTITAKGVGTGGVPSYQYQVVYKQTAQTKWTTAQAFNTNSTVTFKPAKATNYNVCVKVKDKSGTIVKKFFTVTVKGSTLSNTSTLSATTIKKGSKVTARCSATGGKAPYKYAVLVRKITDTNWSIKQTFNTNTNVVFSTAQVANYQVCIKVKDANGTIVSKYISLKST